LRAVFETDTAIWRYAMQNMVRHPQPIPRLDENFAVYFCAADHRLRLGIHVCDFRNSHSREQTVNQSWTMEEMWLLERQK
jgi:hypothetical protein